MAVLFAHFVGVRGAWAGPQLTGKEQEGSQKNIFRFNREASSTNHPRAFPNQSYKNSRCRVWLVFSRKSQPNIRAGNRLTIRLFDGTALLRSCTNARLDNHDPLSLGCRILSSRGARAFCWKRLVIRPEDLQTPRVHI